MLFGMRRLNVYTITVGALSLLASDDWYQLAPSNLAVIETTIDNNNASLWDAVTTETVPYWIRNQVRRSAFR